MKDSLMEALHNASREELIDMIEERMDMDPAFRKIVEHRLKSDAASEPDKQIRAFQNQVMDEMTRRRPDTTVIRSACNVLNRQMESWPAADYCRGCIAIIRTLDSAYANGAGTEDDTHYLISMDIESAAEYAKTRIRLKTLPDSEAEKITALLEAETRKPLEAFGDFIFTDILDGMRES